MRPRSRNLASSAILLFTQITLAQDLGTELTYLLLPSCRQVRNLGQIAAAAAQHGSQDSSSSFHDKYQDALDLPLASHSQASGVRASHGNSHGFFLLYFVFWRERCLGSGK